MPANYVIQDDFPKPSFLDANGKQITDGAKLQKQEVDLMNDFIDQYLLGTLSSIIKANDYKRKLI